MDALRRKYDGLCAQLTERAGADPAAEGAIIEELQRLSDRIVALAREADASRPYGHDEAADDEGEGRPTDAGRMARSFEKVLALLEQQSRNVEHILQRSDEHRDQLERVERRLVETVPLIEHQLPELRAAAERQRQRLTALAIAVQRLMQWLAARHVDRP